MTKRSALGVSRECVRLFAASVAVPLLVMLGMDGSAAAQTLPPVRGERPALAHADTTVETAAHSAAAAPAYVDELRKRADLVNRISDRFTPDAAVAFGAEFKARDWKLEFGTRLMQQPSAVLATALTAPNLGMAQNELFNASQRGTAKLTNPYDMRLNLFNTGPCRVVDTRSGGGGQLGPSYRFWYAIASAATIAAQGGNPAGCGNPSFNPQGWLLYVTVVPPPANTGPNFLAVQYGNTPPVPTSAAINFVNQNIANFVITLNNGNNVGGFYAYASGLTHVVVDLVGWIGQSELSYPLDCFTTTTNNTSNNTGTNTTQAGANNVFNVPACGGIGYVPVATYCEISPLGANDALVGVTSSACTFYTSFAAIVPAYQGASARCCRLGPGS